MNSNSLETWQIERLFKRVQQQLRFLDKLEAGCIKSTSRQTMRFTRE